MFSILSLALLCASAYGFNGRRREVRAARHEEVKDIQLTPKLYERWGEFKKAYGKTPFVNAMDGKSYEESEESVRLEAFARNLKHIESHNREYKQGRKSFELGLNHLADFTDAHYRRLNGFRRPRELGYYQWDNSSKWLPPYNVELPVSLDWRREGLVTEVKNQEDCGSCWAFSATGALEGQHARLTRKLVSLSEQNILDCSFAFGTHGCNGGFMDLAFEYIKENHGVDTEQSYPYVADITKCHFSTRNIGANVTGFVDLPTGDEKQLQIAVATQGPISVAIDARELGFQFYKKGVYIDDQCTSSVDELNHAVLLVGYGTDPKQGDYWLVKNSWGTDWGEEGYIRMARNRHNQCGIASLASFPLV
ncbi:unnamed protein product [Cylicocyclus nassatus]|uniref:Cathepsin L-like n=1 Tax=Cylicocyclus nassatus TaxID=53992 RepID=A0AA36GMN8_CYLNA|nr:unnamed protein product [Cylicocyclus nassatus]